jgi:fructose-1-phosphate kinase PfkB-like protein
VPADGYTALVAAARSAAVPVAVDTRGEALVRTVEAGPDLVKINLHEAGELLGETLSATAGAHAAAAEIRRRAGGEGRAVAVTMGIEGTVLVDPDGQAWHGRLYVRGRYPVGSGDSFLAGLVTGLARSAPWSEAMRLALGGATANAQEPGAGRLDPRRAEALAAQAEVVQLPS